MALQAERLPTIGQLRAFALGAEAVPSISGRSITPLPESLLLPFPFHVLGFHADNGAEPHASSATSSSASSRPARSM